MPRLPECIETKRLIMLVGKSEDAEPLNIATRDTYEDLQRWMIWAETVPTLNQTRNYLEDTLKRFERDQYLHMNIWDRASGELAGTAGYNQIEWSVPRFEVGYWVRKQFQRQGLALEALLALTDCAFKRFGARRVEVRIDPDNAASIKVAERAGLAFECRLKNYKARPGGQIADDLVYAMIR